MEYIKNQKVTNIKTGNPICINIGVSLELSMTTGIEQTIIKRVTTTLKINLSDMP